MRNALFYLLLLLMLSAPSLAHEEDMLLESSPAADAEVESLERIQLNFAEPVEAVQIRLVGPATVSLELTLADDGRSATGIVPDGLEAGRYQVVWQAVATGDGHSVSGVYAFDYTPQEASRSWLQNALLEALVLGCIGAVVGLLWHRFRRSAKLSPER